MRRWGFVVGAVGLGALAFTWAGEDAGAAIGSDALLGAIHAALPPGSELTYGSLDSSAFGDDTRFKDFSLRLGPAQGYASLLKAGELEIKGALTAIAGDGLTIEGRGISREVAGGERLSVESLKAEDIPLTVFVSVLAGQDPGGGRFTGPVQGEGFNLVADGSHISVGPFTWTRLASDQVSSVQVARVELRSPQADRIQIESLALGDLDWARVDLLGLEQAMLAMAVANAREKEAKRTPAPGGQSLEADPNAYLFAALDGFAAVAEGSLKGFELKGLQLHPGGPDTPRLNVATLRLDELTGQRIGPIRLDGLSSVDPEFTMRLDGATYDAVIDRLPLAELRQLLTTVPRNDTGAAQLAGLLAQLEGRYTLGMTSLFVAPPGASGGIALNDLAVAASASSERDQTTVTLGRFALDLAAVLESEEGPEAAAKLRGAGLERASGGLRASWGTDKRSRRASIDDFLLELDDLARLELSGEIAGDTNLLSPEQVWDQARLVRARLAYDDRSLLRRVLATAMGEGGMPPEMLGETFAEFVSDPDRVPWLGPASREALASFLRAPGRLDITLAPPQPVSPDTLRQLAFTMPERLAPTLGLQIRATPP